MGQTILDTAIQAIHNSYSVLPIRPYNPKHGDKTPALPWKKLQTTPLTEQQANQWFQNDAYGLGIIMGKASQDLTMIELEGKAAPQLPELTSLALNSGLGDLWARLFGWWEQTPTGGYHWYCRVPGNTSGNRKLARTASMQVLAETRENGGYSVIAPTDGAQYHHTQQGGWTALQGGPATAPTFTLEEYETILTIFRTLDQAPAKPAPPQPASPGKTSSSFDGVTPLDDFEAKTTWAEILQPAGWTPVYTHGQETLWRRPGKTTGISASTGHATDRDRLYVWTTSTQFEPETPYTKQAAYTLINHDGDYHKAAKHLATQGYGKPAEHRRPTPAERSLDKFINQLQTKQKNSNNTDIETSKEKTPLNSGAEANTSLSQLDNNSEPLIYTRTDDGNALRFADQNENNIAYIPELGHWAIWNGHIYDTTSGDEAATNLARNLARNLPETDHEGKKSKPDINHKLKSLSKNSITSMLYLARNDDRLWKPITDFDNNPYELNTPNGVINLTTGKLTKHTTHRNYLRSTSVTPQPGPAPKWAKFLDETFLSDTELINYVQRAFGLALIGTVLEQKFFLFHGQGANGKTTIVNIMQRLLGTGTTGYTVTVPADMLIGSATSRHPTELTTLTGARIAIASELEAGQIVNEARFKQLTGRDYISARRMHQDFYDFKPTHTLFLSTNHEPEVRMGGQAFWRRMSKIPFLNTVPPEKRNPNLENELVETEGPQILQWVIDGTKQYLQTGLDEPEAVKVATSEYENEQDTIAQFISDCCQIAPPNNPMNVETPKNKIYTTYQWWCRQNGVKELTQRRFSQELAIKGIRESQSHNPRRYVGISIADTGEGTLDNALNC